MLDPLLLPVPMRFALSRPTADIVMFGAFDVVLRGFKGGIPLVAHWVRALQYPPSSFTYKKMEEKNKKH